MSKKLKKKLTGIVTSIAIVTLALVLDKLGVINIQDYISYEKDVAQVSSIDDTLYEVIRVVDGDTFVIKQHFRSNGSIIENECKEFCYLIKSEKLGRKYFFANHPDAEPLPLSSDEISLYDVEANFVVVWVD
jgi:hypothetical protein